MISLDLDNVKLLNDAHGHAVGDLLLVEVANRLKACVRAIDTVARLGGDEFVVLVSELASDRADSLAQAHSVAEKISARLREPYILSIGREGFPDKVVAHRCSASLGVVLFVGAETSPAQVLIDADAAMYRAKEAGRNSIWLDGASR